MTLEEAKKVAAIVSLADGGCSQCVGVLVAELNEQFPQFLWSRNKDKPLLKQAEVRERT